jgi:hypothetical protein
MATKTKRQIAPTLIYLSQASEDVWAELLKAFRCPTCNGYLQRTCGKNFGCHKGLSHSQLRGRALALTICGGLSAKFGLKDSPGSILLAIQRRISAIQAAG